MIQKIGKLTWRFIIPASLLTLLIFLVLLWLLSNVAKESLASALQEKGRSLADNLAYNSEIGVLAGQKEKLRQLTDGVLRDEDVVYVTVTGENGEILAISKKNNYAPTTPYEIVAPVVTIEKQETREEIGLELTSVANTNKNTRKIGVVTVGVSTERVSRTVDGFFMVLGGASLLSILAIAIVVGTTIYRVVIRPTRKLAYSMQQVAEGELSIQVNIHGDDEIAQLSRSFNSMAVSLKEARDKLEQRVEERTIELSKAMKELEAFSYTVSHDLRAPLRAIDGFSRVLQEECTDKLDKEGQRYLNIIRNNTKNMGHLIDDLLAFSKLGRQEIRRSEIDMTQLVKQVFEDVKAAHAERSLELRMETLPRVFGDRSLIRQVLTNLISNAAKFTKSREQALIEISAAENEQDILFTVKDNGVGFDMKYVDKLFGVFQRLHTTDQFEGTGVGLAIVQRVLERHGGTISAYGEPDIGATFAFTLPRKEGHNDTK
jgi:signal transduction histidine kinase